MSNEVCDVQCEHGGRCTLDVDHDDPMHEAHGVIDRLLCEWARTEGETRAPLQTGEQIGTALGKLLDKMAGGL